MHLIALVGLAIVVFASTNIDDIFVLLGFFADSRLHRRNVGIGQYLGIGALVAVSIAASLVSLFLAPPLVGLLGVLPILLGVKKLFELHRAAEIETRAADPARGSSFGQIASVASVTVANGGDNLGIYARHYLRRERLGNCRHGDRVRGDDRALDCDCVPAG